ncbi:MAG: hypothetical protein PETM_02222 [Petrimonas sp.]|uniref:hypothetical protein n=1 Tax=Petrimonas sp. TaxID=2023866 RepID=UPI0030D30CB9
MMKLPLSVAERLRLMRKGDKIPSSKMKHPVINAMIENGTLHKQVIGRRKALLYITSTERLEDYLRNHLGINDLDLYIEGLKQDDLTRAAAINIASDSKLKTIRTFKGFLINCYDPIECLLKKEYILLQPQDGMLLFIYDFEEFTPPADVTIVGIENPENFRYIQKQRYLFLDIKPLFVSRYPQSHDLIKWLQMIPNRYIHFGDLDYAGLNIYINEFKKYLKNRATFFLPPGYEELLSEKGNRKNYDKQTILFDKAEIEEENVLRLISVIEKEKKGLEQEIFIK